MKKKLTLSLDDIPQASKDLAKKIRGGEIFALIGPLGAGKTTFTQTLGRQLGIKKRIPSPTFTLMNAYTLKPSAKNTLKKPFTLYHLDIYRTNSYREVAELGLPEIWGRPDTVVLIEWADKIKRYLPKQTNFIYFDEEHIPKS